MVSCFLLLLLIQGGTAAAPTERAPGETAAEPALGEASAAPAAPQGAFDPAGLFVRAAAAYDEGDYAAAAELYRRLLDGGLVDGRLDYNLGNAYLRSGQLGRAIAAYRAGRRLRPRDQDLAANLAFARRSTRDAIAPPEPSAVATTLFFWHYALSARETEWLLLAVNLLFWGACAASLSRRRSAAWRWLAGLLLVPLLGLAASLAVHRWAPTRVAVVVPQEIEARTAPDPEALVRFKLHAGTEVRVRDQRRGWLRIALPDGQQAWIEEEWAVVVSG